MLLLFSYFLNINIHCVSSERFWYNVGLQCNVRIFFILCIVMNCLLHYDSDFAKTHKKERTVTSPYWKKCKILLFF